MPATVYFPQMRMMVRPNKNFASSYGTVHMKIPLTMNKLQVKTWLKQMYNVDVIKVNTQVRHGDVRRDLGNGAYFRRQKWKEAIVTIDNTTYLEDFAALEDGDVATV